MNLLEKHHGGFPRKRYAQDLRAVEISFATDGYIQNQTLDFILVEATGEDIWSVLLMCGNDCWGETMPGTNPYLLVLCV